MLPARIFAALKRGGQVVVELLLILPVFLMMIFFIMELGNVAFQTILVHHCAYELARIGSLIAGPNQSNARNGQVSTGLARSKMQAALQEMFPQTYGRAVLSVTIGSSRPDPQSGSTNEDMVVALTYPARLVFPFSSRMLSSPNSRGYRKIMATVKMPIEKPLFK
ncbi:MAG: TadE/TadG family type IV pilus assembly protein [Elusimicrobiales bacterium]|nr:TadE/TadG family type IV pilus assembly protein [Elusimicrobiales bacterium]